MTAEYSISARMLLLLFVLTNTAAVVGPGCEGWESEKNLPSTAWCWLRLWLYKRPLAACEAFNVLDNQPHKATHQQYITLSPLLLPLLQQKRAAGWKERNIIKQLMEVFCALVTGVEAEGCRGTVIVFAAENKGATTILS